MTMEYTVELMLSSDYRRRFMGEYYQLMIRIDRLTKLLEKWDAGELDFVPSCPRWLLQKQLDAMNDYKNVLYERSIIEFYCVDVFAADKTD